MSQEIEKKLNKIPVINLSVRFGKKIKIPGLVGLSLYEVLEMYIIGIIQGALTTRAGGIAYSFFMAVFPFMLFILTLMPYVHIDGFQEGLIDLIRETLPPETFDAVDTVLLDILKNKQVGLLSFGFLASIFLMTNGVNAIFGGFEYSIHIKEVRNIIRTYFVSMGVSLLIVFFLFITIALTVFYEFGIQLLIEKGWLENEILWIHIGRGFLFLMMIYTTIALLYRFGTKMRNYRFISPGAILTTILYILTFYLFSYYVVEFSKYNELYGSIGTLLILMLFIWLNSIILLLGFELNASIYSLQIQNMSKNS